MVNYYKLDKVITQGTEYTMDSDLFYIIRKVGTDSTGGAKLRIAGRDTGEIVANVAPMRPYSSNELGPLDLGDLFYVVPPDKVFTVEGDSGDKMRIIGEIGELAPGESLPASFAARYAEQGDHYLRYDEGSKLYSVDYTWSDGEEITVYELTPATREKFIFNNIVEVETGVSGLDVGEAGVILELDGKPLDVLTDNQGPKGLDAYFFPRPPAYNTVNVPFSLADKPIEVPGDITFKIKLINVSGGNLTVAAATDQYITMVVEYIRSA